MIYYGLIRQTLNYTHTHTRLTLQNSLTHKVGCFIKTLPSKIEIKCSQCSVFVVLCVGIWHKPWGHQCYPYSSLLRQLQYVQLMLDQLLSIRSYHNLKQLNSLLDSDHIKLLADQKFGPDTFPYTAQLQLHEKEVGGVLLYMALSLNPQRCNLVVAIPNTYQVGTPRLHNHQNYRPMAH